MKRIAAFVIGLGLAMGVPLQAGAEEACTLVVRAGDGDVLYRSGPDCDRRFSPASTFKLALAAIGFDAGLLHSPEVPVRPHDPTLRASFEVWRQPTSPQRWLRHSVVWYSQWLTTELGRERLQTYVDRLDYGNRDLSGDPGKDNGLTHAWLSSSLRISPVEQIDFLSRLLNSQVPLAPGALRLMGDTVQRFEVKGPVASVAGKTGNAWATDASGARTDEQHGWFVGWTEIEGETYVFARLNVEKTPSKGFASSRTRASMLSDLPGLLAGVLRR